MLRKAASDSTTQPIIDGILRQIHDEDPSYWPYGLSADQFNGGLYTVHKSASHDPVGFVGWQKFPEGHRTIGYYAIGILPEHRQQGFAKSAVSQALREIGDQCDEVRAFIMSHNAPSKALARSVGIPMIEKLATSWKAQAAQSLAGALGSAAFFDQTADPERSLGSTFKPWEWDKERALMGGMNAILGGVGGHQLGQGKIIEGLAALALAPTKDLALKGTGSLHRIDEAAKKFSETAGVGSSGKLSPAVLAGAGGLGLGALALLAYSAKRKADHRAEELALQNKGRVRITLPTASPGDNETEVELPFDDLNLSHALRSRLGRDTRRRLYTETRQRTRRRPAKNPSRATPKEVEDLELEREEEELDKAATLGSLVDEIFFYKAAVAPAPQGAIPSPPIPGQNPAMRMAQQEQAVAKSIQPAPEANPEILKAQQAAMQAEQAGQQQMAQMEQASQQAQMEQQAQFQQALAKSEQEKEVLKLQLEKEKALKELSDAQTEAVDEVGRGSGGQAQELVASRISRLESRVKAAAAAPVPHPPAAAAPVPGTLDPQTGQKVPQPAIHLRPQTAQAYNRHAEASGMLAPVSVARHSYGKIGDTIFDLMARQRLMTPDPPERSMMAGASLVNTPDRMWAIENFLSNPYATAAAGSLAGLS